jgi:DNA-binding NtrC family response regulator
MSTYKQIMLELRRGVLLDALNKADYNLSLCARNLSLHRNSLERLLKQSDIHWRELRIYRDSLMKLAEKKSQK